MKLWTKVIRRTGVNVRASAIAAVGVCACFLSVALADAGAPLDQSKPPPEVMEPPIESTAPPTDPSTGDAHANEPLTKKLEEGEGVLEPPRGLDPEIKKAPPGDFKSTMPVIPPPGEPGGDESVQPK